MRHTLLAVALLAPMLSTTARAADAEAEAEVAKLAKQYSEALVKGDATTLDAILADDWVVIGPDGDVVTKDGQAKDLKVEAVDFVAMDASEVKVRVYGDAAVVTGRCQVKVKLSGQETGGPVRRTDFFAKVGGKWRCVSTQVTRIASQSGEVRAGDSPHDAMIRDGVTPAAQAVNAAAVTLLRSAQDLEKAGQMRRALAHYGLVVKVYPDTPQAKTAFQRIKVIEREAVR